jgi:2-polyprenyl-6-methoxyphenol hydroxylase-like FAD-dependent oxidoreductase
MRLMSAPVCASSRAALLAASPPSGRLSAARRRRAQQPACRGARLTAAPSQRPAPTFFQPDVTQKLKQPYTIAHKSHTVHAHACDTASTPPPLRPHRAPGTPQGFQALPYDLLVGADGARSWVRGDLIVAGQQRGWASVSGSRAGASHHFVASRPALVQEAWVHALPCLCS